MHQILQVFERNYGGGGDVVMDGGSAGDSHDNFHSVRVVQGSGIHDALHWRRRSVLPRTSGFSCGSIHMVRLHLCLLASRKHEAAEFHSSYIVSCCMLHRFGDLFSFSILSKRITVVNTPKSINFVLSTAHDSFPDGYDHFFQLLTDGKFYNPLYHPFNRKTVLSAVTGDGLQSLLPFINTMAANTVKKWEDMEVVNTVDEVAKYVFKVMMHVIRRDVDPESEDMEMYRKDTAFVLGGIGCAPINLPGFYFHKALKTRAMMTSRIQESISRRRAGDVEVNDLMNAVMNTKEVELPDDVVCPIIMTLMSAASDTTVALIAWVLKYLHEFPDVHQRVQEEQESIQEKMVEDTTLTWFKPKSSMPYTLQVIYEVLRIQALAPCLPRQANKDVDFNGYVFRKGSTVWASVASVMSDPEYYPNPEEFKPSRFEEKPQSNLFLPFGQGPHLCPGNDLGITEVMLLVHHLITNYRWESYGLDQGVIYTPVRKPGGGFPIIVTKK